MTTPSAINEQQQTSQSILHAVENEDRARRRTLLIFLSLLVIPVAVAAYILVSGKEDADWVISTAQKAAASEIEGIRPALNNVQNLQKIAPALEKTVALSEEYSTRLQDLESTVESAKFQSAELTTQINETKEQQASLENKINTMESQSPTKNQISALTSKVENQAKILDRLTDMQRQINRNIEINSGEIKNVRSLQQSASGSEYIDRKFKDLESRLEKLIRDNHNEIIGLKKNQKIPPSQFPLMKP